MKFQNLNSLSALRVKARFGVPATLLAELRFLVLAELERRRTARLEGRSDRNRSWSPTTDARARSRRCPKGSGRWAT